MTLEVRVLAAEFASVMGVSFRNLVKNGSPSVTLRAYRAAFHLQWEFQLTHYSRFSPKPPRANLPLERQNPARAHHRSGTPPARNCVRAMHGVPSRGLRGPDDGPRTYPMRRGKRSFAGRLKSRSGQSTPCRWSVRPRYCSQRRVKGSQPASFSVYLDEGHTLCLDVSAASSCRITS